MKSIIANRTEVSVEGYVGTGTIIERVEGGYVVRGRIPNPNDPTGDLVHEAVVSEYMVTPVDDAHPAIGTTYLDPETGTVYRIRGYSNYTEGPNIAVQYPGGGMSTVRGDAWAVLALDVVWTSRFLVRAV